MPNDLSYAKNRVKRKKNGVSRGFWEKIHIFQRYIIRLEVNDNDIL